MYVGERSLKPVGLWRKDLLQDSLANKRAEESRFHTVKSTIGEIAQTEPAMVTSTCGHSCEFIGLLYNGSANHNQEP